MPTTEPHRDKVKLIPSQARNRFSKSFFTISPFKITPPLKGAFDKGSKKPASMEEKNMIESICEETKAACDADNRDNPERGGYCCGADTAQSWTMEAAVGYYKQDHPEAYPGWEARD